MTRFTLSSAAALAACAALTALAQGPALSRTTPGAAPGTGAVVRYAGIAVASVNPDGSSAAARR